MYTLRCLFFPSYILTLLLASTNGSIRSMGTAAWNKFWKISCDYTTLVSRSKRSTEVPNMGNVDDIFEYLYPSAHVQVEDLVEHGGRSDAPAFTFRSFATWIDHLIDLWHTECQTMTQTSQKDEKEEIPTKDGIIAAERNSSAITVEYKNKTLRQPGPPGIGDFIPPLDQLPTIFPTLFPTLPIPTPSALLTKTDDRFFAAYGGDIEYFIPLVSYGIPFDGEVTVLGFHGFKGLFPYK